MDGWMEGWVIEGKTDGEGTAKQQVQSSGLPTGQWKADRPIVKAFFILCPAHLCVLVAASHRAWQTGSNHSGERFTQKPRS